MSSMVEKVKDNVEEIKQLVIQLITEYATIEKWNDNRFHPNNVWLLGCFLQ